LINLQEISTITEFKQLGSNLQTRLTNIVKFRKANPNHDKQVKIDSIERFYSSSVRDYLKMLSKLLTMKRKIA